jgi:hypothetical protein
LRRHHRRRRRRADRTLPFGRHGAGEGVAVGGLPFHRPSAAAARHTAASAAIRSGGSALPAARALRGP